jgi:hypothetical protein
MPLPKAHLFFDHREVESRLDETVDALAQSRISLQRSNEALIRSKRDNDHQRQQLAEFRRAIGLLETPLSPASASLVNSCDGVTRP